MRRVEKAVGISTRSKYVNEAMVVRGKMSTGILNLRTFITENEIYSILGVETCLPRNKARKSSGKPSDFLVLFLGRHVSTPRIEEISFPAMNVLRINIFRYS